MNDRFKFRAWNKETKTMHYNAEQTYDCMTGTPLIYKSSFGDVLEDEDYIVEQCTGMKDKNGKLIFEGDILDNDFVVVWADFGWGFERSGVVTMFQANMTHFEVTSNIHKIRS